MILSKNSITTLLLSVMLLTGCVNLKIDHINTTPGYSNVVSVSYGKLRTLYIAGQTGSGSTMEEQFRTSFENVLTQLDAAGASFSDVVKITLYIVDYQEEYLPVISQVRKEVFGTGKMPAITMVGVEALAIDHMKVETEAVAIKKKR